MKVFPSEFFSIVGNYWEYLGKWSKNKSYIKLNNGKVVCIKTNGVMANTKLVTRLKTSAPYCCGINTRNRIEQNPFIVHVLQVIVICFRSLYGLEMRLLKNHEISCFFFIFLQTKYLFRMTQEPKCVLSSFRREIKKLEYRVKEGLIFYSRVFYILTFVFEFNWNCRWVFFHFIHCGNQFCSLIGWFLYKRFLYMYEQIVSKRFYVFKLFNVECPTSGFQ